MNDAGSAEAFAQPMCVSDIGNAADEPSCIRVRVTSAKVFGRPLDDDNWGTAAAGPITNWYLHVREESVDQTTQSGCWFWLAVTYTVEFASRAVVAIPVA